MTVYVVMGNDYPDRVYSSAEAADRYVSERMVDPFNRHVTRLPNGAEYVGSHKIYYRSYDFELRSGEMAHSIAELEEWKRTIIGLCVALGSDAMAWGGDKTGWGFIHYFVKHLHTRAEAAEALATARAEGKAEGMDAGMRKAAERQNRAHPERRSQLNEAIARLRRAEFEAGYSSSMYGGTWNSRPADASTDLWKLIEHLLAAIPTPAVGAVPEPDPTDGLPPIDSIILGALLHLPVPGETLRMAAMQVRSVLERSGNLSSAVPEQGERETAAARDVMAERERQKLVKGWTAEHDDEHAAGEMAAAACCYAFTSVKSPHYLGHIWPWSSTWWKPADKRRNLVKAGALILAEIERLDRAARLRAPDGVRETVAADERAVERKAIELATAANMIWEELEDYGSGGENRTTYRKLAVSRLRAPDGEGV